MSRSTRRSHELDLSSANVLLSLQAAGPLSASSLARSSSQSFNPNNQQSAHGHSSVNAQSIHMSHQIYGSSDSLPERNSQTRTHGSSSSFGISSSASGQGASLFSKPMSINSHRLLEARIQNEYASNTPASDSLSALAEIATLSHSNDPRLASLTSGQYNASSFSHPHCAYDNAPANSLGEDGDDESYLHSRKMVASKTSTRQNNSKVSAGRSIAVDNLSSKSGNPLAAFAVIESGMSTSLKSPLSSASASSLSISNASSSCTVGGRVKSCAYCALSVCPDCMRLTADTSKGAATPRTCHSPEQGRLVCAHCAGHQRSIEIDTSRVRGVAATRAAELRLRLAQLEFERRRRRDSPSSGGGNAVFAASATIPSKSSSSPPATSNSALESSTLVPSSISGRFDSLDPSACDGIDYRCFANVYTDFGGLARCFEIFDAADRTLWAASLPISLIFVFPTACHAQVAHAHFPDLLMHIDPKDVSTSHPYSITPITSDATTLSPSHELTSPSEELSTSPEATSETQIQLSNVPTGSFLILRLCAQCNAYQALYPTNRVPAAHILRSAALVLNTSNNMQYSHHGLIPNFYSTSLCRKNNASHIKKYRKKVFMSDGPNMSGADGSQESNTIDADDVDHSDDRSAKDIAPSSSPARQSTTIPSSASPHPSPLSSTSRAAESSSRPTTLATAASQEELQSLQAAYSSAVATLPPGSDAYVLSVISRLLHQPQPHLSPANSSISNSATLSSGREQILELIRLLNSIAVGDRNALQWLEQQLFIMQHSMLLRQDQKIMKQEQSTQSQILLSLQNNSHHLSQTQNEPSNRVLKSGVANVVCTAQDAANMIMNVTKASFDLEIVIKLFLEKKFAEYCGLVDSLTMSNFATTFQYLRFQVLAKMACILDSTVSFRPSEMFEQLVNPLSHVSLVDPTLFLVNAFLQVLYDTRTQIQYIESRRCSNQLSSTPDTSVKNEEDIDQSEETRSKRAKHHHGHQSDSIPQFTEELILMQRRLMELLDLLLAFDSLEAPDQEPSVSDLNPTALHLLIVHLRAQSLGLLAWVASKVSAGSDELLVNVDVVCRYALALCSQPSLSMISSEELLSSTMLSSLGSSPWDPNLTKQARVFDLSTLTRQDNPPVHSYLLDIALRCPWASSSLYHTALLPLTILMNNQLDSSANAVSCISPEDVGVLPILGVPPTQTNRARKARRGSVSSTTEESATRCPSPTSSPPLSRSSSLSSKPELSAVDVDGLFAWNFQHTPTYVAFSNSPMLNHSSAVVIGSMAVPLATQTSQFHSIDAFVAERVRRVQQAIETKLGQTQRTLTALATLPSFSKKVVSIDSLSSASSGAILEVGVVSVPDMPSDRQYLYHLRAFLSLAMRCQHIPSVTCAVFAMAVDYFWARHSYIDVASRLLNRLRQSCADWLSEHECVGSLSTSAPQSSALSSSTIPFSSSSSSSSSSSTSAFSSSKFSCVLSGSVNAQLSVYLRHIHELAERAFHFLEQRRHDSTSLTSASTLSSFLKFPMSIDDLM